MIELKQPSGQTPQARNLYIGIDALRCAAALAVMSYHYLFLVAYPGPTPNRITNGLITEPVLPAFTGLGYLGVQVFFVISGFVIYASLNANSAGQFLTKRFLRLAPALWICASITLVVALLAHDGSLGKIITRYLISVTFFPFGKQIDGSYWTLRVEVGFYLSIFAVMWFSRQKLEIYFRTLCLANFLISAVSFLGIMKREWLGNLGDIFVLHHGSYFAVGIFLNKLAVQKERSLTNYVLMGFAILGSFAHLGSGAPMAEVFTLWSIWVVLLAIIVFAVVADPLLSQWVGKNGAKSVRAVGKATYPFYLVHQLVGCFVIFLAMSAGFSQVTSAAIALITIIAITFFVTRAESRLVNRLKPGVTSLSARLDQRSAGSISAAAE